MSATDRSAAGAERNDMFTATLSESDPEIAAAIAEVGIGQAQEDRADSLQRTRHRPLGRQALFGDRPPRLAGQLGAAQNQTMRLDELVTPTAVLPVDLALQKVELSVSGDDRAFEARYLRLAVVAEDPPLGDRHPHLHQVRRTDRDPARRTGPSETNQRLTAATVRGAAESGNHRFSTAPIVQP